MAEKRANVADEGTGAEPLSMLAKSQREINEQLVITALEAHEQADASEARETELIATAELREQLIGILGHDLRNPLGAIMMGAGVLLSRGNLDDADSQIVERIVSSGSRMTRMIRQVLEFTRARLGGGLELERQSADLGDLCRNVADELEIGTSVPVRCTVKSNVRGMWDVDRLTQLLSNIGGNAVEHATRGTSVEILVRAEANDAIVEITNSGAPIPDEVLPHLFEPFRRAKGAVPGSSNLGLGLYIASEVARAHHGQLSARSADGKTTFTVRLPRSQDPNPTS